MDFSAKLSVSSWWILAFMALFLWYRNETYDRALAPFVFTLGLIQLIEYGIHSGANTHQAGRAIFITLWLQCLVLAISVFVFIKNSIDIDNPSMNENIVTTIAGWNLFLFSFVFVVILIYAMISDVNFSAVATPSGRIEWTRGNQPLLNKWACWLYILGLFVPLILILAFYSWMNIGMAILILYGVLVGVYTISNYYTTTFSNLWCYFSIGFAFLSWFVGIVPKNLHDNNNIKIE